MVEENEKEMDEIGYQGESIMFNLEIIGERIQAIQTRKERIKNILNKFEVALPEAEQEISKFSYRLSAKSLKELKVACVMDRFTLDSYSPECNLLELTPDGWKEEIDSFLPDLIFIESAWKGKNDSWYRKIANGSREYFEMTSYCQSKDIPIVFWNKEDPIYTDTFMPAARMADFVFTTDIDCIKKYKETLRHDRVYFLHFAAQPNIHNPIEKYERKDKYCFAGAYYHKYKKRAEVFDNFSKVFIDTKGLDIYDRNYQSALPEHAFPKAYNPYILGKLDPSEIDIAYKGYNYGINMNSVNQSQTMFARRVFEMLASNTVTVGNYSRGVKNLFGDLTISTDDAKELRRCLDLYCNDTLVFRKYRLAGLRKVLQEHLYEDRLDYIVQKVFGKSIKKKLPEVQLIADGRNAEEERLVSMFKKQTYTNASLYIISNSEKVDHNVHYISEKTAKTKLLASLPSSVLVGVWNPSDYYGPNYLHDLVYTLRYGNYNGIGKNGYYSYNESEYQSIHLEKVYKPCDILTCRRSIFKTDLEDIKLYSFYDLVSKETIKNSISDLDSNSNFVFSFFSADEFNYCENLKEDNCPFVDDMMLPDKGICLREIEQMAESIKINTKIEQGVHLQAENLFELIKVKNLPDITVSLQQQNLYCMSTLAEDKNQYIYFEKLYPVADAMIGNKFTILFDGIGSTEVLGVCVFYDEKKVKLSPIFPRTGTMGSFDVPSSAAFVKLGIRIRGTGEYRLKKISMGIEHSPEEKAVFLSRSNVLVLSNQYPSYDNLYRNMFVHKRMMAYKEDGFVYDVMRMNIYAKDGFHEFEGINIVEGQSQTLANILETGQIQTVCVHFLDRQMWEVLKQFGKKIRILVWVHGSEIQPWWRREYNYTSDAELEKGKQDSAIRMKFWKEVFDDLPNHNIHFVFVSQYFADEIFEDNKIKLSPDSYSIIHNCIDTEMFHYVKKDPEQRKHLLSIRPYASRKYANDLTVNCILELSKKDFFNDLSFTLIGNGDLFEETVKPLRKFSNVTLQKTFLRQEEIAEYHKKFGIFITPTRMDAQGVSRDEAMSSGLVPVTNAVTAIPEFVDESCGILAPSEDYLEMTAGIEKLYREPELFEMMSKNASERVKRQTAKEHTIVREEQLINYKLI